MLRLSASAQTGIHSAKAGVMRPLLAAILKRFITRGTLMVRWPDGSTDTFQGAPGPRASVAVRNAAAVRQLILHPSLALGEAYMDGTVAPLGGDLYGMLELLCVNAALNGGAHPALRASEQTRRWLRRLHQFNPAARARRNVAHHYDLDGRLYSLFLDRDRQYSCAYFPHGDETLDEAQAAKKRHIAAKLLLTRPGLRVLDIGCGWGGMALTLARDHGAQVLGITLSTEQLEAARARAAAEGLGDQVSFELLDYRQLTGRFDRIVSVGMFEHVGVGHYGEFFTTLQRCLEPGGVALLHTIGRSAGPSSTDPWIARYIFPGGYAPALSELVPHVERSGLIATDIEVLRLHYAKTLRHWRERFAAQRAAVARLYDERFCRMFEFYLAVSELAFRLFGQVNFQVQLAHQATTVPLTRDYIAASEAAAGPQPAAASEIVTLAAGRRCDPAPAAVSSVRRWLPPRRTAE